MKKDIFTQALQAAEQKGFALKSKQSISFFNNYANKYLYSVNSTFDIKDTKQTILAEATKKSIMPGQLIIFDYKPIGSDKLPYYDKTPLVIPLYGDAKTFTGLNLHYLPPKFRAKVLDIIYKENGKTALGYLHLLAKSEFFSVCVKKYLYTQIRSKIQIFKEDHWEIAVFLPTANFAKQSQSSVFANANKTIQKHRKNNGIRR